MATRNRRMIGDPPVTWEDVRNLEKDWRDAAGAPDVMKCSVWSVFSVSPGCSAVRIADFDTRDAAEKAALLENDGSDSTSSSDRYEVRLVDRR